MHQDNHVIFDFSPEMELTGSLTHVSRYQVVFEVYDPHIILRISQVLEPFKIVVHDRTVYQGRAVISSTVHTGTLLICQATLDESWVDVDLVGGIPRGEQLRGAFDAFLRTTQQNFKVLPEFKVAVADMQMLLMDLRQWLEQVELSLRANPLEYAPGPDPEALEQLHQAMCPAIGILFERFEEVSAKVEESLQPAHESYLRRFLHPIVLCAPFVFRTFRKPLGYAGDYEMVNMMLRAPYEGDTLFAKVLNAFFLGTPPVVAHRHRIAYLTELLKDEGRRLTERGAPLTVFNIGCGPAKEVEEFMRRSALSDRSQLTLLDFNEETLGYTRQVLAAAKQNYQRRTKIELVRKSISELLRDSSRESGLTPRYDFIYCAGLFDYLPDQTCQRLLSFFYDIITPGGLMAVTNVEQGNPSRHSMEYVLDWHLVYRTREELIGFCPKKAPKECTSIKADPTGLNIFLEVRKP